MSIPARSTTATPKAAQVINFDEIRCEYVDVTKRGHTWHLRDDIPMEIMVRGFALRGIGERLQALGDANEEEMAATFDDADEETVPVCADIFRHSYPDMTDDEIAATFSLEERMQLIQVFFQRRSAALQAQPVATSSATAAVAAATPVNRMQRRATRQTTRRESTAKPTL